mmetsp:Transcript_28023/g.86830  ORF Transcript_28023/g.86830 Transcript_28023/m.86830 type:complete len:202 (+) Transcript_28023:926-1531(+)
MGRRRSATTWLLCRGSCCTAGTTRCWTPWRLPALTKRLRPTVAANPRTGRMTLRRNASSACSTRVWMIRGSLRRMKCCRCPTLSRAPTSAPIAAALLGKTVSTVTARHVPRFSSGVDSASPICVANASRATACRVSIRNQRKRWLDPRCRLRPNGALGRAPSAHPRPSTARTQRPTTVFLAVPFLFCFPPFLPLFGYDCAS